ncbi:60Kd inner membrane protein-domain-containing protein [Massariosphaeria phaeospora]|uniref:60Kd inner membrane protein-domain-containing protein n=1 Tax=Massariosphaeria phaeospora TaxID=100035 RepID=A0A7C8I7F7_9PLEO|nr:60Kd inner membrane protein-domain-containing protein [Massariosphaeria phaeospora]
MDQTSLFITRKSHTVIGMAHVHLHQMDCQGWGPALANSSLGALIFFELAALLRIFRRQLNMLPSRGLRPAHFALSIPRPYLSNRSIAARQFSSIPRKPTRTKLSSRTNPLQSTNWRAGASTPQHTLFAASSVRYGSWYAPWSWGQSSTPPAAGAVTTSSENLIDPAAVPEPVMTTATPELAPAGIDQPAVVESASTQDPQTLEELLNIKAIPPPAEIVPLDPSNALTQLGQLKALGLDYGWGTSAFFEWMIEHIYIMGDLGWGGSIIASGLVLRSFMFYFQMQGSHSMAKMAAMKPLTESYEKETKLAIKSGDVARQQTAKQRQSMVYKEVGVDPFAALKPMAVQVVFGFGAFRCLRGISDLPAPGLTEQGFLWFQNLSVSDPYYILPVITGGVSYALLKLGGETGLQNENTQADARKTLQVVFPVIMMAITFYQPAALQIYFLTTTCLGVCTGYLLRQAWFRRVFRLHALPTPESNALFSKVVSGEIKLDAITGEDGKVTYQVPTQGRAAKVRGSDEEAIKARGITLKTGAVVPAHMRKPRPVIDSQYPDRDVDFDDGAPKGLGEKVNWVWRNYKPSLVARRVVKSAYAILGRSNKADPDELRRVRAKQKAKDYEVQRKRRFEQRL